MRGQRKLHGTDDVGVAVSKIVKKYKLAKHFTLDITDNLDLRPIFHYLSERVRSHVFLCLLAAYITHGRFEIE